MEGVAEFPLVFSSVLLPYSEGGGSVCTELIFQMRKSSKQSVFLVSESVLGTGQRSEQGRGGWLRFSWLNSPRILSRLGCPQQRPEAKSSTLEIQLRCGN